MCGRITLALPSLQAVADALSATARAEHVGLYRPRYNVAPADAHWVLLAAPEGRTLLPGRWGFGARSGRPLINARAESLKPGGPLERPSGFLGKAFAERRCVVPADGFFEWTGPRAARRPLWFHRQDGGLLYLAGLWEEGEAGLPRFLVLTTEANQLVAPVHHRMPVLLSREAVADWLARPAAELLAPAPESLLVVREVSPRVNSVQNDDASLLDTPERAPDMPKRGQLELL